MNIEEPTLVGLLAIDPQLYVVCHGDDARCVSAMLPQSATFSTDRRKAPGRVKVLYNFPPPGPVGFQEVEVELPTAP